MKINIGKHDWSVDDDDKQSISTYGDLLEYLMELLRKDDSRLNDTLTIREGDGEWYPAELLENQGSEDDVLDDGHLFFLSKDWNE